MMKVPWFDDFLPDDATRCGPRARKNWIKRNMQSSRCAFLYCSVKLESDEGKCNPLKTGFFRKWKKSWKKGRGFDSAVTFICYGMQRRCCRLIAI
jgi:hypothetical protein